MSEEFGVRSSEFGADVAGGGSARGRRTLASLIAVAFVLIMTVDAFAQTRRVWLPPEPTLHERLVMFAVQAGLWVWVFVLGSVIGSYLNVVAYRLPKGKPLFWPPSSCPSCGNRIAIRDNVPVLGWLLLKGKCRNCGQPISPRYPLVEALVGALFVILANAELFTDGANLPHHHADRGAATSNLLLFPQTTIVALYLFHATWVSTMVAVVLIDVDRQPMPARKFLTWMGTLALLAVALLPDLLPVKLAPVGWANDRVEAVMQSLAGMALGLGFGWFDRRSFMSGSAVSLGLIGACFGWQALVVVAVAGGIAASIERAKTTKMSLACPLSFWFSLMSFLHLLTWKWWTAVPVLWGK
jgi:leader peptidase (prepilin peptidase)/N-methyltransferase